MHKFCIIIKLHNREQNYVKDIKNVATANKRKATKRKKSPPAKAGRKASSTKKQGGLLSKLFGKKETPAKKPTKKSALYEFRRYKKVEGGKVKSAKHPKLIVDESKNEFGFMGLTESKKRGHHNNIELTKNPEKGNNEKAYIRKELRYDDKNNFSKPLADYRLSDKDKPKIQVIVDKYKQKKK